MSEERSIPDALLEAVAELNRAVDHIAPPIDPLQPLENALQALLQNIENERRADRLNFDPLQPLENALQLYGQQREERSAEERQEQVQPAEEQPAEHQHGGGSRVQNDAVTRREQFNNFEIRRVFNIPSPDDAADLAQFYLDVRDNFVDLADRVRPEVSHNDRVQLEIISEHARNHAVFIVGESAENIVPAFEDLLPRLIQSNGAIVVGSPLEIVVQVIRNPRGGGGPLKKIHKTLDDEILIKKRRCLYVVKNKNDNLCFAINLAHLTDPHFTDKQALERGRELQRLAGLSDRTQVTLTDIDKFEQILNRKIVVFYRPPEDRTLSLIETESPNTPRPLYLFLFRHHYYGIKNLKTFLGVKHICEECHRGYHILEEHFCQNRCNLCFDPACPAHFLDAVICPDCNRSCRTRECYLKHKQPRIHSSSGLSVCQQLYKCPDCKLLSRREKHRCRAVRCKICGAELPPDKNQHMCYIQPLKHESPDTASIIFYDFETFPDREGTHVPYLVCTKSLEGEEWHAYGVDCVEKFVQRYRRKRYRETTFIAHNAKGFDSYIILSHLVGEGMTPSLIMQGSKIICFTESDFLLKFIDSLSFLTMRLSAMPKALGFEDKSKDFFPHKFSSRDRLKYVGPYPPPSDYGVERMSLSEREEFLRWHGEASRGVFNFEKESLYYCQNDVNILREACIKFRDGFIGETKIDPFSCVTIASACMKVFLTNFLPKNTLAIPSPDNYGRTSKAYSHASIRWLEWVARSQKIPIQHALTTGGEKKIGPYYVDGYALINGEKWVWEFLGCFYHGCPKCYRPEEICPLTCAPYGNLHASTEARLRELRNVYRVRTLTLWEHEWSEMKKSNEEVKKFLRSYEALEPLSPRSGLYGGRTSALRLRYSASPGENVYYVDVTSLYSYVNAKRAYPLHHPKIIRENFVDPRRYFGLIRATVYPPRGLYFPVLPYKTPGGKLIFSLCRICAETNHQSGPCPHDDEARALTGVWVTVEFNKALELGYRVAKITEVWHFDRRSSDIFAGYINTFLKGKQEASGYPPEARDEEERSKYVEEYHRHQGIRLDPSKIKVNLAKRQAKKQDVALIQWSYNERCVIPPGASNNVFIAAFTTAYARLKLYEYLEKLQRNVLYTDTDSLIYVVKEGEKPLQLGNFLGDLTDELHGDTIQEFVSAGPKSYAYRTRNKKKLVVKMKGITQTRECCERVNFDSMSELVESYLSWYEGGGARDPSARHSEG
ncbi:olfactory receptor [Sarotherodon galilaeus]